MHNLARKLGIAATAAATLMVAACSGNSSSGTSSATSAATSASSAAGSSSPAATSSSATSATSTSATGSATVSSSGTGGGAGGALTPVKLQLQWVTQAQFAGYITALSKGYYKDQGLDVQILQGGVDIVPQTVLASGQADYAIAWVPKALQSREQGAKIVDVGQVFQRSGTLQVSFKDKNIVAPGDLREKIVGNWGFGNEYELFAGMTKAGLDPGADVTIAQQQFDMNALLNGDIDAAQAMVYNEYAQVLEAKNPATGALYQPADFNAINWNDVGTAMLQDAVWADETRLTDPAYQDTTVKFLTASYQGWIYCADHAQECRDLVVAAGSKLGASHQLWQMNEVNKLIWPSPNGIGTVDAAAWDQTVQVAQSAKNADGQTVLTKPPTDGSYTNEFTDKALANLKAMGMDTAGSSFAPITVTLNEGGN